MTAFSSGACMLLERRKGSSSGRWSSQTIWAKTMCEILAWRRDKDRTGVTDDRPTFQAGDVIDIRPDGWKWGVEERKHPDWVIIKAPRVPVENLMDYMRSDYMPG